MLKVDGPEKRLWEGLRGQRKSKKERGGRGQLQGSGEEEAVAAPGWLTVLESVLEASRHQREESGETRSRDRAELPDHGGSVSPASVRPLPPGNLVKDTLITLSENREDRSPLFVPQCR